MTKTKVQASEALGAPTAGQLLEMFTTMARIRAFETVVVERFLAGQIPGFVHTYIGEEAIATGVMATLREDDFITSTHRGHGHIIAKGGDSQQMMAELYGKACGCCKGRGGSMHLADPTIGILGANGIVGAGLPIATGAALACQYKDSDAVVACFFGDGAANRGTFHESLNLAALWGLPVVYVCENNQYGEYTAQRDHMKVCDIAGRAAAYGIPAKKVDGNDVAAVYGAAASAVAAARCGAGPTLIECTTWRHRGHNEGEPMRYRDQAEHESWLAKDPLPRCGTLIVAQGSSTEAELDRILAEAMEEMNAAADYAEGCAAPSEDEVRTDVYSS